MRKKSISRRTFFTGGLGAGAGLLALRHPFRSLLGGEPSPAGGGIPLLVSSHDNETGKRAVREGWKILSRGGSALDAVEKAANIVESDPDDMSVGIGGFPNEDGVVQLDASVMDGKTYSAGSVACLENIKTPSSVARIVMEKTDHVMLVGAGALGFAKKWGFKEENLLTEKTRKLWMEWKENANPDDIWGPPSHLRKAAEKPKMSASTGFEVPVHGTVNMLAVDREGHIAGITTTSGWGGKIAGRVGDSPIIGAGLYVDEEVGAAGATGRGEDVIKSCASYYILMRMREGRHPQDACMDALKMILSKYSRINTDFYPGEKFIAISKRGEYGCASMPSPGPPRMAVIGRKGLVLHEGLPLDRPSR